MFLQTSYITYLSALTIVTVISSILASSNFTPHLPGGISPEQVGEGERGTGEGMFGDTGGLLRDASQLWWPSAI